MVSMNPLSLHRLVTYLPLVWQASLAFAGQAELCAYPPGIEKCQVCAPTNAADLTTGSGGYGFGPDGLPCFGDTGPYPWGGQGPSPNGTSGSTSSNGTSGSTGSNGTTGPSGNLRVFYLTVTWGTRAPDGNARDLFLINDQFPGPKLEMNQGDDVEIHFQNNSPFNTTIHFHGIEQFRTPWSDGVPGISQRGVRPGEMFVYKWKATQYGSYWYHSHQTTQIDDGFFGPIVIHAATDQPTPYSLISSDPKTLAAIQTAVDNVRPLLLSDWSKYTGPQREDFTLKSGIVDLCYDSLLFNGKGNVRCYTPAELQAVTTPAQRPGLNAVNATGLTAKGCLPARTISLQAPRVVKNYAALPSDVYDVCIPTTGSREVIDVVDDGSGDQWLALDLIATFGVLAIAFSIDSHTMYIYAVDGSFVEPIPVEEIPIQNAARFSVLIKLQDLGNFAMRVSSIGASQSISNYATLSYHEAGQPAPNTPSVQYMNDVGGNATANVRVFRQSQMKAFPPVTIPQTVEQTFVLSMIVAGQTYLWALNNTIYPLTHQMDPPILFHPQPFISNNVTISTYNNTWVDIVFVTATYPQPQHPMHKHGGKMYMIGQGTGPFPWATVAEAMQAVPGSFNLVDPPRRDVFATAATVNQTAWLAIRYYSYDPGAWLLHCHISSHFDGGMSVAIQDGVDVPPVIPPEYLNF
ncbi:hypothetical protein diail_1014 [Diaporthe ilicicola]|nr:hypothetical protein diail_1014 [Diaporthe ilicicola]